MAMLLAACPEQEQPKTKTTQAQHAKEAAESINFTENAEIDNIKDRLELTSDPGLLGFVTLVNNVGQVALYTPVKGKVTSGSKRLTSTERLIRGDRGANYGDFLGSAPSDEGTYGSSNPYIYFWTPNGRYIQTSMDYVYSDQPFRLNAEPLMVLVENEVAE